MEVYLHHTNEIYINFFTTGMLLPLIACIPAVVHLLRCKIKGIEYKIKYKLLWLVPIIFLIILVLNAGLYMVDYTFDRIDVQTVFVEEVDRNNAGTYLISGRNKFFVSRSDYIGDEDVSDIIEDYVVGHTCEIESYMSSNNVIRIEVLD